MGGLAFKALGVWPFGGLGFRVLGLGCLKDSLKGFLKAI